MTAPCSWVEPFANSVTALAAVAAAVAAWNGLDAWKRQLKGQHAYDVARRTYLGLLQVREAVASLRSPATFTAEMYLAAQEAGITIVNHKDLRGAEIRYAVQHRRWNAIVKPMQELEANVIEAEVVISDEVAKLFARLRKHIWQLKMALDHELQRLDDAGPPGKMEPFDREQRDILGWSAQDKDAYAEELQVLIKEFAALLRPHLS